MNSVENKRQTLTETAENAAILFSQGDFETARTALAPFFENIPSKTYGKPQIYWKVAALYIACENHKGSKDQRIEKYKELLAQGKNRILFELSEGQSTQNRHSATPSNLEGLPGGASAGGVDKSARSVLCYAPSL